MCRVTVGSPTTITRLLHAHTLPPLKEPIIMALKLTVKFKLKPRKGQTKKDAKKEFTRLFQEYLSNKEGAFLNDYGPGTWGGYEGPFVTAVTVHGPGNPE